MGTSVTPFYGSPVKDLPKRQQLEILRVQMENERTQWLPVWKECANFVQPTRARFVVGKANKPNRLNKLIIDSTAIFASRTLSAGMLSGITSPAREWFRLSVSDPALRDVPAVKDWLHEVSTRMYAVFSKSNLYDELALLYTDLGAFGTACMLEVEDPEHTVRFETFSVGSYCIAVDASKRVRVFQRCFQMTVRQILDQWSTKNAQNQYDLTNFSTTIRHAVETGALEMNVEICHIIRPNPEFNPNYAQSKFKKFESVYYETGAGKANEFSNYTGVIVEEGFDEFPLFGPRWEVGAGDIYGVNSPAIMAIGDIKQLQHGEKKSLQAIDKLVDPPMTGPTSLKAFRASILPGDITYADSQSDRGGFRTAYEIDPKIKEMEGKQEQVRQRINRAFYVDLFLMISSDDSAEPRTATEIVERKEEKLIVLGPVLERMNHDLLDPMIDRTFAIMLRRGDIPDAPQELQGQALKVEYTSVMAAAQRALALGGLERLSQFLTALAQIKPDVVDKVDFDQLIDEYADGVGAPPHIVIPDDQVAATRQQRAQAAQAQQMSENLKTAGQGVQSLANAPTDSENALTQILQNGVQPK